MKTLRHLILLSRIGMLPLSLSVPIIGALSLQQTPTFIHLLALAGIGTCSHFFGFVFNDLMDHALDKNHPYRQQSLLVTGMVKRWQAWAFVLLQIPIAIDLYLGVLHGDAGGLIWLTLSVSLSVVYNLFSKWRWLPRILAEIALAASVTLLGISGAWAFQPDLPPEALLYCGTMGLILLLVNSVPSGLKDIQFDQQFGARSFVIATGTKATSDGQLIFSPFLRRYMIGLQLIISLLVMLMSFIYPVGWAARGLMMVLEIYAGLHVLRLLRIQHVEEFRRVILFLGGFYNYFAMVLVIWSYLPLLLQLIVGVVLLQLLSIPLRRAWSVYRRRHKTIVAS